MNDKARNYCSWCFHEAVFKLVKKPLLGRSLYQCGHCARHVSECRATGCTNYARWDAEEALPEGGASPSTRSEHEQFCAEHGGLIANFRSLTASLADPSEWEQIYEGRATNWKRNTRIAGIGLLGLTVGGPLGLYLAEAVGGAVGVYFLGLSGAAAESAGLAILGGGSLAAGGFGMAGGLAVVTVGGAALGGTAGAMLGNRYLGHVRGFGIRKIRDGRSPALVTVNGFLAEGETDTSDWARGLKRFDDRAWYHVDWEARTLNELASAILLPGRMAGHADELARIVQKASKKAAKKFGPSFTVMQVIALASNPWHVAMVKAEMTGVLLAETLSRCKGMEFTLCGHSLGARVVYSALTTLAGSAAKRVRDVHLFGGAVGNQPGEWAYARNALTGRVVNYHSSNDNVLWLLYRIGTFFASAPIGTNPIQGVDGAVNVDVSAHVSGHPKYKRNADQFLVP